MLNHKLIQILTISFLLIGIILCFYFKILISEARRAYRDLLLVVYYFSIMNHIRYYIANEEILLG